MNDVATQQRFVQLRCEGWSFARIAKELKVSKPTLIMMDESLNPYLEQQIRLQQARARDQEIHALLARVYGLAPPISG